MKPNHQSCDVMVAGGGFFGMYIAEYLAKAGRRVLLVEREGDFMLRASFHNQARVHNGCHYPRSILTALRSRISFPRFAEEFRDCIRDDFRSFYLIGKHLGNVSAAQFRQFCDRIGAPCEGAPEWLRKLTDPHYIEDCFSTVEFAFDAQALRDVMAARLEAAGVEVLFHCSADRVRHEGGRLAVVLRGEGEEHEIDCGDLFNCTYSSLNSLLANSGLDPVPLKYELAEMCLVDVPPELEQVGITVMCGPFFSVMPFPPSGRHSFSHVRYTPHTAWNDEADTAVRTAPRPSAWNHMRKDAARYIPMLAECRYESSMWEVKALLPRSESDDSRPILFRPDHGLPGLHCVLGGKIDNVYDVLAAIEARGLAG